MKSIYLCGAINGCSDSQCNDWRKKVKEQLGDHFTFLDPMRRDYRGKEDASVREIIAGDEQDIRDCDYVLAAADIPSWGTAMEIRAADKEFFKETIIICGAQRISPWLRGHATHLVSTLDEAIALLRTLA